MSRRPVVAFAAGVALWGVGSISLGALAEEHPQHAGHGNGTTSRPAETHAFIRAMDLGMANMMADMHAPGYSGNWDVDFLVMMIPHHQGAIDMARLVLVHGHDPHTRALAEDIIASQQVEIDSMRARLAMLRSKSRAAGTDEYPSLSGTRGGDDSDGRQ